MKTIEKNKGYNEAKNYLFVKVNYWEYVKDNKLTTKPNIEKTKLFATNYYSLYPDLVIYDDEDFEDRVMVKKVDHRHVILEVRNLAVKEKGGHSLLKATPKEYEVTLNLGEEIKLTTRTLDNGKTVAISFWHLDKDDD